MLSERTINKIALAITGDSGLSVYRTGPKLVRLFNEIGYNDIYGTNFPSRYTYVEQNIRNMENGSILSKLFEIYLDPRDYIEGNFSREKIAEELNKYLKYDGFELIKKPNDFYQLKSNKFSIVDMENEQKIGEDYILEQLGKCKEKIDLEDYRGAITNARTLLEEVFLELVFQKTGEKMKNDGDLLKLFKSVQENFNLDPAQSGVNPSIKQILQGLSSVINGLAALRNKMSDSHGAEYQPGKHHAKLAVNAAKTIADFLYDTHEYQLSKLHSK